MNTLKMLAANAASIAGSNNSLYQIHSNLGLTTSLKICVDAGDTASYDPAVQTVSWLDTSGQGYNLWRGNTSAATTDDPTFNGTTGGLSNLEYWSLDGGDYFSSANRTTFPTMLNNAHKNNALFTFGCVFYMAASTSRVGMILTGSSLAGAGPGIIVTTDTSRKFVFVVCGSGAIVYNLTSTTAFNASAWNVVQLSIDEASDVYVLNVNGTTETGACTYSSPSTASPFAYPRLGISGYAANTPNTISPSGTRFAGIVVHDVALTSSDLTNIFNGVRGRFGL